MLKQILFMILLFSTSVVANDDIGSVFFGKNFAKTLGEHTDWLYLVINDSEKLYFNRMHEGPVLEGLNLTNDHVVKVYFNDKIAQSWILNFSNLKSQKVIIWRPAGSWRMEVLEASTD